MHIHSPFAVQLCRNQSNKGDLGWNDAMNARDFVQLVLQNPGPSMIKFIEEVRQCQEIFTLFDKDGNAAVSVSELSNALTKLFRRRPTQFEMKRLIQTVNGSAYCDMTGLTP